MFGALSVEVSLKSFNIFKGILNFLRFNIPIHISLFSFSLIQNEIQIQKEATYEKNLREFFHNSLKSSKIRIYHYQFNGILSVSGQGQYAYLLVG